ncbi:MAG: hypothetical protein LBF34_01365 [Puniceicoccales bacterium]|jgi:hypothetical protein|nr:hypothetical protein [Puniceicoccales bacterium]
MLKHILSKKRNVLPLVVWSFVVLNGETACHAAAPESPLTGGFSFNQSGYPSVFLPNWPDSDRTTRELHVEPRPEIDEEESNNEEESDGNALDRIFAKARNLRQSCREWTPEENEMIQRFRRLRSQQAETDGTQAMDYSQDDD